MIDVFLFAVVCACMAIEAVVRVDKAARAGERVYIARHRDHSKVPSIREAVERADSRRVWLADDDGPAFHLDVAAMRLSARDGWRD